MTTIEEVGGRLDGLERENRRLRWVTAGLLTGFVLLGAMAILSRDRGGRTLEAQRLVIRDQDGRLRGSFGVDRDGLPALKVFDHRGHEQIELGVPSDDVATLALSDHGVNRVVLDTSIEGTTSLRLFDQWSRPRTAFLVRPDGSSEMSLGQGERSVTLALRPDGEPMLVTTDDLGRPVERPIAKSDSPAPSATGPDEFPGESSSLLNSETWPGL
jgi:hypothetical protein